MQDPSTVFNVLDYLAYTLKICDLFKHYDKCSVVQFDREYRHLQSVYEFRWGTDAPHLHSTRLRPKIMYSHNTGTPSFNREKHRHAAEICKLYNTSKGCHYASNCKFLHKCSEPAYEKVHSRARAHVAPPHTQHSRETSNV